MCTLHRSVCLSDEHERIIDNGMGCVLRSEIHDQSVPLPVRIGLDVPVFCVHDACRRMRLMAPMGPRQPSRYQQPSTDGWRSSARPWRLVRLLPLRAACLELFIPTLALGDATKASYQADV